MLESPTDILAHDASLDAARGFIKWRKAIKKPLTERAAVLIAKSLRAITADGGDADEALDLAAEHGWQTIKPDWYWGIKNGNGNRNSQGGQMAGGSDALRGGQGRSIASIAAQRRLAGEI